MKHTLLASLALLSILFASCATKDRDAAVEAGLPTKSETSYAFGVAIGSSLKETTIELDYAEFLKGVKDVMVKDKPSISAEEANAVIQTALGAVAEKQNAAKADEEKVFLEANGKKAGVVTTASGLQYEVLKEGSGPKASADDTVTVDYVGTFADGTPFDSSIDRGEPAVFVLNQVIPGWTEGMQLMNKGAKYRLYVPSELAYGADGAAGVIPPFATLIFEVDLLSIDKTVAP